MGISEISFTIHWAWIVWPLAVITSIVVFGGIGFLAAKEKYKTQPPKRRSL